MRFTYFMPRKTDKQKEHSKTSPEKCLPRERVHQVSNKSSSLEASENSKEREKTQRSKLRNSEMVTQTGLHPRAGREHTLAHPPWAPTPALPGSRREGGGAGLLSR